MKSRLEKIYKSALKFLVPLTPEETYKTIVHEAVKLTGARYGSILLEKEGALYRAYTSFPPLYNIVPRKKGVTYRVFRSNKPHIEKVKDIIPIHPIMGETRATVDLMMPLSYHEKPIGVLAILSKPKKTFTKNDIDTLKAFAPFATLAIQKSQAYAETKTALETRDLFIAMASHELKTPLTTINVYIQLMQKKINSGEKIETRWVETLLKEVKRLTKLVRELLQVDQIKIGKFQYEWNTIRMHEVIGEAIKNVHANFPNHSIDFTNNTKDGQDIVHGDFDKLVQAFINILNNSAKYSSKNSPIYVSMSSNDSHIALDVTDYGKGIAKEELPKIFERFYRGTGSQHEGMGLGLFLTKQIIDDHRGTITIDSELNKGTTIRISLPKDE